MPEIELFNGRSAGDGHPVVFICEGGLNHNGDIVLAKEIIAKAKLMGADAVKFQKRTKERILTKAALEAPYCGENSYGTTYGEHRDALEFDKNQWKELKGYADHVGIVLTGSPWDEQSADVLDEIGVPFFKVASADLMNFPLLKHIAMKMKPMIISTGMSDMKDIRSAVDFLSQYTTDFAILHCTSTYPTKVEDVNLNALLALKREFPDYVIGYSGHENGIVISQASATLGAKIIERHFTLDRTMKGGDHAASLEARGFLSMIQGTRKVEKALGDGIKRVMPGEDKVLAKLKKSIVASHDLPAGTVLTEKMISLKSPGTGLGGNMIDTILGKVLLEDLKEDDLILPRHLEGSY